jgi:hypothetical protein
VCCCVSDHTLNSSVAAAAAACTLLLTKLQLHSRSFSGTCFNTSFRTSSGKDEMPDMTLEGWQITNQKEKRTAGAAEKSK